jgi:phosphatidylserine decarboxylase
MFAKEGLYFVIPSILINVFIISFFNWFYADVYSTYFPYFGWFYSPLLVLTAFFIFFFRDPDRKPEGDGILAPTDGTVTFVKQEKNKTTIFIELAASDVHTQRSPVEGKILNVEKIKGAHHPIYFVNTSKSENEYTIPVNKNERIKIDMVDTNGVKMKITQIAGAVARRCRSYVKTGDIVQRGERIGIIMFGSLLKYEIEGQYEIVKGIGEHVKSGKHVLLKRLQ